MKKKFLALFMVFVTTFVLIACDNTPEPIEKYDFEPVVAEIAKMYQEGDSINSVTKDLNLKTSLASFPEVSISWASDKENVVSISGKVTRQAADTNVKLTATLSYLDETLPRTFNIVVKGLPVVQNKYTLTLPAGVTADKTGEIVENSEVTLNVAVPEGKEIDELKVNGTVVTVTNNTYKFNIKQNTTVTVTFKDVVVPVETFTLTLPAAGVTADKTGDITKDTEVTLTVAAPDGKVLDELKVNGTVVTVTNNTYKFNITQNTTVLVSFKDETPVVNKYTITLVEGVTADFEGEINENTEVTLTVTAPDGKEFVSLTVNGEVVTVTNGTYKFTITKNTTVAVEFKAIVEPVETFTLELPAGVTADKTGAIAKGTEVTLTVAAPEGQVLDELKVNGEVVTVTNGTYKFTIIKDTTVLVSFKDETPVVNKYTITLVEGVTADFEGEINENTEVTLTVTAPDGKEFVSLTVNGVVVTVTNGTYKFTITKNTTVAVEFKAIVEPVETFTLELPAGVTADKTGAIAKGTEVTLTVNPGEGKELDQLKVNGEVVTVTNGTYKFTIIKDTTVEVEFKVIVPEITFTLTLPAEVTADKTSPVIENAEVTLTVTVPEEQVLDKLFVNDVEVVVTNNKAVITITKDTVVKVTFTDITSREVATDEELLYALTNNKTIDIVLTTNVKLTESVSLTKKVNILTGEFTVDLNGEILEFGQTTNNEDYIIKGNFNNGVININNTKGHFEVENIKGTNLEVNITASAFGTVILVGQFNKVLISDTNGYTVIEAAVTELETTEGTIIVITPEVLAKIENQNSIKGQIFSSIPVASIGEVKYESLQEAVDAVKEGETVVLLKDTKGNGIIVAENTTFTLDLGGNTYTIDGELVGSSGTETNGFQLLKGSTITIKNGKITSEKALIIIQNYSNLTLDNVELIGGKDTIYTLSNNNGKTVIKNKSVISAKEGKVAFDVYYWPSSNYPSVSVEISDDTVVINGRIEYASDGSEGFAENAKITIPIDYILTAPNGYEWIESDEEGFMELVISVAKIGNVRYETLQQAVDDVQKGETIVLNANTTGDGLIVPKEKEFTLDLNGYTYTIDGELVGSSGTETNGFQLLKGSTITIKNGKITSEKALIIIQNYSNLTLDNVELIGGKDTIYTLSNNNGKTVIKNKSVISAKEGKVAFDVYYWPSSNYPSVSVEISDDTVVINGRIEYASDGSEGFAENAKITIPIDYILTAPNGYEWVELKDKQALTDENHVANVSNETELLTALINEDITTINFIDNIHVKDVVQVKRNVTINGNGKTLSRDETTNWVSANSHVIMVFQKHDVFIHDLVISGSIGGLQLNSSTVTIKNLTFEKQSGRAIEVSHGANPGDNELKLYIEGSITNNNDAGIPVILMDVEMYNDNVIGEHELIMVEYKEYKLVLFFDVLPE